MKKGIFFLLIVFALFLCGQNATGQDWNELLEQADSLSEAGNYDSAIVIGQMALERVKAEFGTEDTAAARVLYSLGDYYLCTADYDKAEPLLDRSLDMRERNLGLDHPDVAQSLYGLANLYRDQDKYDEAEPLYKRALAIRESVLGPEQPDVAEVLNNLGVLYKDEGRYAEAEPLYKRALAISEKAYGPEHSDVANCLSNLAELYFYQGEYTEAESLYKRALDIKEKVLGAEHASVAISLNGLAVLYDTQAKYAEAERLHKRALAIREKVFGPDHVSVAASLNNLALLYRDQGQYAKVEPLLLRVLAIFEKALSPNHTSVATILNNLGVFYKNQGRYAEAEPLHKRAMAIWEEVYGPEHLYVAISLDNLAALYKHHGRYAEAESLYKRVLAIWEKAYGPEHSDLALFLSHLAELYFYQGEYTEAESLYKRALEIDEKVLGTEHPVVAWILNNLARLYCKQGKYAETESLHERALALLEKTVGIKHIEVAMTLSYLSLLYRLQDKSALALEYAHHANRIRQEHFIENAVVLSENDALTFSQFLQKSVSNYLTCQFAMGFTNRNMIREAADIVFSIKGQVSDGIFQRGRVLVEEKDSTTLALAESLRLTKFHLSQLFIKGPTNDLEAYRNQVDSLGKLTNELEADLARRSTSFERRLSYRNVTTEKINNALPGGSVLVEYLKFGFQELKPDTTIPWYLAVVLNPSGNVSVIDLGPASKIDSMVEQYRKHLLKISAPGHFLSENDLKEYWEISSQLYDLLWEPLMTSIPKDQTVLISPDGALNLISFAGLTDEKGQYLVEKHPIHYLSAGRDVLRYVDEAPSGKGLFALGDPDYNATALARTFAETEEDTESVEIVDKYATRNVRSGCEYLKERNFPPLPGTRSEIEKITRSWEKTKKESITKYFGSNASEEVFKQEAPGNRVIHLATHGYFIQGECQPQVKQRAFGDEPGFVGENPLLLSGLLLAGANLRGEGADSIGVEDGILTALEVSSMDFSGTDMVVLSACETGLGEVKSGEGVYGLRRAFLLTGARMVVSALWPVSDQATGELMERLYKGEGQNMAEIMQAYALEKIKVARKKKMPDHPYFWAPFIAIGDWKLE